MSLEPDVPADTERDTGDVEPESAVDELEEAVTGGSHGETADPAEDDDPPSPAFELDLDPEQQGTSAAAAANPD